MSSPEAGERAGRGAGQREDAGHRQHESVISGGVVTIRGGGRGRSTPGGTYSAATGGPASRITRRG
ncbi:hypothetical protein [Streptomyces sp. NPDC001135]